MAADFQPGDYVAHPAHGACRVVGVGDVTAAGQTFAALTLTPLAHPSAIVRIPASKLCCARLRVVTAAEAAAMQDPHAQRSESWKERMRFYGKRGGAAFAEKCRQARM